MHGSNMEDSKIAPEICLGMAKKPCESGYLWGVPITETRTRTMMGTRMGLVLAETGDKVPAAWRLAKSPIK